MSQRTPPEATEALHREQVDSVFRQLRLILGVDAVSGSMLAVFALVFAERIYSGTYLWLGALYLNCGIFYLLGRTHIHRHSDAHNSKFRERFLFSMAAISGIIWGCSWLIAPVSAEFLVVAPKGATLIWFCLMLANATIVLSVDHKLFLSFAVPAVALHVAFSLYMGADQDIRIAGALIVILAFATFMALRSGREQNNTIRLRMRNDELKQELSKDASILEQREAELVMRTVREEALLLEKQDSDNKLAMAAKEKLLLLDALSEGIFGINNQGNISFVNAMALQLLGFKESEVLGCNALEILCRSKTEMGKEAITRKSLNLCLFKSESVKNVDGIFCGVGDLALPVRFSCKPITEDGNLIGAVVSFMDMTDQLNMENKLLQSEKMEAIGRITGGVAHDFNNLLTVIMGNLQLLRRRLSSEGRQRDTDSIDTLLRAAKNGAEMNKRLLSFSREQALVSKLEDVDKVLLDLQSFIHGAIGEDIDLVLNLSEEGNTAKIDKTQFENVIINLCVNAKDAMPEGGRLEITTSRGTAPPDIAQGRTDALDFIRITVRDNGFGIPEDIQDKVFDPFFTTKDVGEGSGFGLSTAFGFMQQSGGSITMESRRRQGTTFTLHLPLATENSAPMEPEAANDELSAENFTGNILLVEDDASVRDVATQMLLDAGYTVITADNGNAGLERFIENSNIDLVFSDVMMPGGMNGFEMAKRILERNPNTPILLATGYTKQILKDKIEESAKMVCISKPYDTDKLPVLIHSMLSTA